MANGSDPTKARREPTSADLEVLREMDAAVDAAIIRNAAIAQPLLSAGAAANAGRSASDNAPGEETRLVPAPAARYYTQGDHLKGFVPKGWTGKQWFGLSEPVRRAIIGVMQALSIGSEVGYGLNQLYASADAITTPLKHFGVDVPAGGVIDKTANTTSAVLGGGDAVACSLFIANNKKVTMNMDSFFRAIDEAFHPTGGMTPEQERINRLIKIGAGVCFLAYPFGALSVITGIVRFAGGFSGGAITTGALAFLGQLCLYTLTAGQNPIKAAKFLNRVYKGEISCADLFTKESAMATLSGFVGFFVRGGSFAYNPILFAMLLGAAKDNPIAIGFGVLAAGSAAIMNTLCVAGPEISNAVDAKRKKELEDARKAYEKIIAAESKVSAVSAGIEAGGLTTDVDSALQVARQAAVQALVEAGGAVAEASTAREAAIGPAITRAYKITKAGVERVDTVVKALEEAIARSNAASGVAASATDVSTAAAPSALIPARDAPRAGVDAASIVLALFLAMCTYGSRVVSLPDFFNTIAGTNTPEDYSVPLAVVALVLGGFAFYAWGKMAFGGLQSTIFYPALSAVIPECGSYRRLPTDHVSPEAAAKHAEAAGAASIASADVPAALGLQDYAAVGELHRARSGSASGERRLSVSGGLVVGGSNEGRVRDKPTGTGNTVGLGWTAVKPADDASLDAGRTY